MFFHMCEMSPSFEPKIAYKQIPPWMRMVVRWHRWKINHILLLKRSANNNSWVAQAITKWILSVNIWEFKNKRNKWFFHFCLMFYRISLPSFLFWYLFIVLEWAHFSSNSSFIKLQNFEFEHATSSRMFHFLSLSSSLETSFPIFGLNIMNISNFIEFKFPLNKLVEFSSFE